MTNPKKEFLGIYAPTFYLLTTFFVQQFAQCVTQPESDVTGPSGSSMMCFGIFFINAVLWVPAGVTCVILQIRRSRALESGTHSDLLRHNVSAAIGLMLLLLTAKTVDYAPEIWPIIAISGVVNLGICGFFFAIGCGLRSSNRLQDAEQAVSSDGHKPTSHASSADPTAPADAH